MLRGAVTRVRVRPGALLGCLLAAACALVAPAPTHAQQGWTEAVQVPHAAHAVAHGPSALVHAGPDFDAAAPLQLVVFLHGYMACARMLIEQGAVVCRAGDPPLEGRGLARAHDAAQRGTLFVVPQLAFLQRTGKPGCFARPGCFRAFLEEALAAIPSARITPRKRVQDVASITLVAHSAGYEAALAILQHGQVEALIRDVVLFDALYGEQHAYLAWFARHPKARLVSLHLRGGRPARNSAALLRAARRQLADSAGKLEADIATPDFGAALAPLRVATARVEGSHREQPTRHLTAVLRALAQARAADRAR
jgi:hypothetical protein